MDIIEKKEIRFRPQRPARASVARWETYIVQAAQMPMDAALRLPWTREGLDYKRSEITAAVRRYARGKLFVRSDVDGRLILTRRRVRAVPKISPPGRAIIGATPLLETLEWPQVGGTYGVIAEPGNLKQPVFISRYFDGVASSARPGSHDANGSPVEGDGG